MGDKKTENNIIYPLPGDKKGQVIASGVTDSEGKYSVKVMSPRPGRYPIQAVSGDGKAKSEVVYVQVTPKCDSKGEIKMGNDALRAAIRSATKPDEIQRIVDESRSYFDLAKVNLKKTALKEFIKTSANAANRIEQLRQREQSWGVTASKDGIGGFGIKKTTKKSGLRQL